MREGATKHLSFKEIGLRDVGYNMNAALDTRKSIFMSQQWLGVHIWFITTLYYKIPQILQNATVILLQNVTKIQNYSGFLLQV